MIRQNFYQLKNRITSSSFVLDSFWALLGSLFSKGSGLISSIFIARFLGSEIFGNYGMIKNLIMSTTIFSTFGLAYTATKFISENRNNKFGLLKLTKLLFKICLFFGLIFGGMIFFFGDFISVNILNSTLLKEPIKIAAVIIIFTAISSTQTGVIAGLGSFKNLAKFNIPLGIATVLISVLLSYYYGISGAIYALLFIQLITIFFYYRVIILSINKLESSQDSAIEIGIPTVVKESLPIALQEGVYSILYFLNFWIVINFSSYSELGIYSASMQWYAIILFIPGILRNVILSHLAKPNSVGNGKKRIVEKTALFNLLITAIPTVILIIISPFIISFYGDSFAQMRPVLIVGLIASIFSAIGNVYSQAFIASGQTWELFFTRLFRDAGITIVSYLLIINSNGESAAFYLSCSLLLFHLISIIIMYKRIKYD